MPEKTIQDYLFQRIKELLPPGKTLVDTVSETLHISPDSAYRRIRGETLLVLEETKTLCQQFNISLDQFLNLTGKSVVFERIELNNETYDFKTYLKGILEHLQLLNAFDQKSIIYMSKDKPVFHQFCSPEVFAFQYFFWMKTILQLPDFAQRKFSLNCLTPELEALGKEILSQYNKIPSIEIWNTESINSTLLQVNYYCEAGLMTREDAQEVYAGLYTVLEHLQLQAEYGRKFLPGENPRSKKDNYQLFYNRVELADTVILTLHDDSKKLFLNCDALNYMFTTDEALCNQVHQRMQLIMRRSTLISSASEKQRQHFFNILYAKIPKPSIKKQKKLAS